ncbi:MAG: DoxX family membrane protein [Phycisphaerales bacterium]|nr:DoxX family membrane protein [Phycisphaerales bacterium]
MNHGDARDSGTSSAAASWLMLTVRLMVASLFLFSSTQKLRGPQNFVLSVEAFDIMPSDPAILLSFVAYAVPWTELLCAILILLGVWARPASLLLSILMVVFTVAIFSVLARGMDVNCGCFGAWLPDQVTWSTPLRNIAILIPVLLLLRFGPGALAADCSGRRVAQPAA